MNVPHLVLIGGLVSTCMALDHPTVAAQSADTPGQRLRAELQDARRVEGVLVDWGTQTLSLRVDQDSVWTSAWADVAAVEWLRTRRRTTRGLGLGAAIGGLGTGLVAAIAIEPCQGTEFCVGPDSRVEGFLVGALIGAALGGAAGLIVGTAVQTSTWEPVAFPGRASSASLGVRWRIPH